MKFFYFFLFVLILSCEKEKCYTIEGKEIIIRNAKEGETFDALDNKKYKLKKNMCVISDKSGVLGLCGII